MDNKSTKTASKFVDDIQFDLEEVTQLLGAPLMLSQLDLQLEAPPKKTTPTKPTDASTT